MDECFYFKPAIVVYNIVVYFVLSLNNSLGTSVVSFTFCLLRHIYPLLDQVRHVLDVALHLMCSLKLQHLTDICLVT